MLHGPQGKEGLDSTEYPSPESDSTDSIHIQDNSFESMTVDEWNDATQGQLVFEPG